MAMEEIRAVSMMTWITYEWSCRRNLNMYGLISIFWGEDGENKMGVL